MTKSPPTIYDKLEPIFQLAHSGDAPVRIDDIAKGVRQVLNRTVTVTDIQYHPAANFAEISGALESVFVTHENGTDDFVAHIYYRKDDNYCWERFAKAKELCQIVLSTEKTNISKFNPMKEFIRNIVSPFMKRFGDPDVLEATELDDLGVIAACEMLFPMKHRHFYIDNLNDQATREKVIAMVKAQDPFDADEWDGSGPRTDFDDSAPIVDLLAFAYRMPKAYVETLLVDDTAYALWRKARNENPARFGDLTRKR